MFSIKKNILKIFLLALITLSMPSFAMAFNTEKFSIGFGTGENQLMYLNKSIKGFGEAYPMGPFDFSISGGKAAVLDWFNKSVKFFNESGAVTEKINIPEILKNEKNDSKITPYITSIYIPKNNSKTVFLGDSNLGKVYKINDQKLEKTFGQRGTGAFEFIQIEQIAVTPNGDLIIGDCANKKISIISKDGKNIRELPWKSFSGFIPDENNDIYLLSYDKSGIFCVYRHDILTGASKSLFKFQKSGWFNAKLIGKDSYGNFIIALFDEPAQKNIAAKSKGGPAPFGYFTIVAFNLNGQSIITPFNLKISAAAGNQFYYDQAGSTIYYQDYNAKDAPKGLYKIGTLKLTPAKPLDITTNFTYDSIYKGKKEVIEIKYSAAPAKDSVTGDFKTLTAAPPIIKTDNAGIVYVLDTAGKKILTLNNKKIETIDLNNYFKNNNIKIDDFFPVSTSEIYILDNTNSNVHKLSLKSKPETVTFNFSKHNVKNIDKIYVSFDGTIALESSINRTFHYMNADGNFKTISKTPEAFCGITKNSNLALLFENKQKNGLSLKFYNFQRESTVKLKGFDIPSNDLTSSARILGDDSQGNIYVAGFSNSAFKIFKYSKDGVKNIETNLNIPLIERFIDTSVAADGKSSVYVGVPTAKSYLIYKVICD